MPRCLTPYNSRPDVRLTLLLLLATLAVAAEGEKTVVAIRFEGNVRYTAEFLRERIETKVKGTLDPGILVRDERTLREFFAAVTEVEEREVPGGVEIVFHVVDEVIAGKVDVQGVGKIEKEDYEPLMRTRKGRPLLDHSMRSDADLLKRLHREKGYHDVEVQSFRRRTPDPRVEDVVFLVYPGNRIRVREVLLEGARSLEKSLILRGARNSDRYRKQFLGLGNILNPSYFDRTALDEDRRRIELIYHREGFLDARVVLTEVRFDAERKYAYVFYRVDEGERYRVSSLAVEYDAAPDAQPAEQDRVFLSPENLQALSTVGKGDPAREEDLDRTRRDIEDRLWSKAYAQARIAIAATPKVEDHTVAVIFRIRAGAKVRLGRLRIYGNQWTRDNVIRREFRDGALPGDYLDLQSLEEGRRRLQSRQWFTLLRFGEGSEPIQGLRKSANADRPDEYDVDFEVQEEETTRSLNVGAGVSTDGGLFGQFSVTWRNFDWRKTPKRPFGFLDEDAYRGGGQSFTFSINPGTTFSDFRISFDDPALNDSRWSFHSSIHRALSRYSDYDLTTDAIEIGVGRYLDPKYRWYLGVEWTIKQVLLDDPEPDAPQNAIDQQGTSVLHGFNVNLRYEDKIEDRYLRGYVGVLRSTLYGTVFGADVDILKFNLDQRIGNRIFRQKSGVWHFWQVSLDVDYAVGLEDTSEVPIYERYFLGGRNLRGFEFREVGPRSNGRPSGGEFMVTLSTIYVVPLSYEPDTGFALDLIFFLDQGSLSEDFGAWTAEDWRISVGVGIALAFGGPSQPPIELDFGFPLRSRDEDQPQLLSINFARNF